MKKKILRLSTLGVVATLAIGGGILLTIPKQNTRAAAIEVFKTSESVTVQNGYAIDSALQTDARQGILLTADKSGASIDFATAMSGAFELDFRVFTQNTPTAEDLAQLTYYPTSELLTASLVFTDANDETNTFSLVIDSSTKLGAIPTAHVEAEGKSVGIFRLARWTWKDYGVHIEKNSFDKHGYFGNWNKANEETKLANAGGEYSYLLDSSFSNVAWYKGSYHKTWTVGSGENAVENAVAPMRVGFDPVTMEVYGYSRGEKIVIWDLDEAYNDGYNAGFVMDGFESFNVSLEFTKLAKEDTAANMVVYAVNGQEVTATAENDTVAPKIYAKATALGLVGEAYAIPAPTAYDLVDGKISTVSVSVFDPDGGEVTVTDGKFTPEKGGEYTVKYTAKDAKDNEGSLEQTVSVYPQIPKTAFAFVEEPQDKKIGVGESAYIPCPVATNAYFAEEIPVKVRIEKDGVVVLEEKPIAEKFAYTFAEAGVYTVIYTNEKTADTYAYTVTVDSATPAYAFSSEWTTVYALNDRIVIPQATATLGEESVKCSVVVEFPNGTRFTNTEFTATVSGEYAAIYKVQFGSKSYELRKEFSVVETAASLFTAVSNTEFTGIGVNAYNDTVVGLNVVTSGTGKFVYNRPINFTDKTATDIFFDFAITPQAYDTSEVMKMMITLTDINDPLNFVQIVIHQDKDMYNCVDIRGGAYGIKTVGLRGTSVLQQDPWGTMISHSSYRNIGTSLQFALDYESRVLYTNGTKVVDLDSPEYFTKLWTGFSEGLATLTFEIVTNVQPKVHYALYSVDGNDLRGNVVADLESPVIKVDTQGYQENALPYGVVGEEYPIFTASAYDKRDGFIPYDLSCYYLLNGLKCEVDTDGVSFVPTETKDYYIEYIAKDGAGNEVVKTLRIGVKEKSELTVSLPETTGEGMTGYAFHLPSLVVENASGEATITRTVKKPDGSKDSFDESYLPTADGEYVFEYAVIDYLGFEAKASYTYTAQRNDMPVVERVQFPAFAVQGEALILPDCVAYDYSDGAQKVAEVVVTVLYNGKETTITDGVFTPEILTKDAEVTIKYTVTLANGKSDSNVYTVLAIQVKGADDKANFEKLFVGENFTLATIASEDGKSEQLVYHTQTDGATLSFVRPVVANNVTFTFGIPAGYENYDAIVITLQDSVDEDNAFTVTITRGSAENKAKWQLSGDKTSYESAGTFGGSFANFSFSYDDSTRVLSASDEKGGKIDLCSVSYDVFGNPFQGFASGLVNLSFTFTGVKGKAGVMPTAMNNVTLEKANSKDRTSPLLYVMGAYGQYVEFGSTQTLFRAVASDVLSSVALSVTVYDPDDNVIYQGPADQVREFTINKYGSYLVQYVALDGAGRTSTSQAFLYCPYEGEVHVEVKGAVKNKASVNSKVYFPSFTAKSDHFDSVEGYIIVFDPNNSMKVIGDLNGNLNGEAYTFKYKGKYVVRYYAIDEDANYKMIDYEVTVY